MSRIYTIGHSTRSFDELLSMLEAHGVRSLIDVRAYPRSRRHPQFNIEQLSAVLPAHGILYRHLRTLGGRRRPRLQTSVNAAWRDVSFRAYADHMQTSEFQAGLTTLLAIAEEQGPAAFMCAEALWWHCHRMLLSDALLAHGHEVKHIQSTSQAVAAKLTDFAVVTADRVTYPAPQGELFGSRRQGDAPPLTDRTGDRHFDRG